MRHVWIFLEVADDPLELLTLANLRDDVDSVAILLKKMLGYTVELHVQVLAV
eukprot:CAMPEP_0115548572 /NCGR_PEP_ID=MMETSP0271-20121206/94234_1 /TAXON_ID=71861 /ORGANISM="Scrippsiella trochoidea, Strain CCMP3099" /LENGTH=51 /DNA_ID=CAMNT_0002982045 /DNA_START=114 /DNA_END=269 /DNA_ORIENTATION=-